MRLVILVLSFNLILGCILNNNDERKVKKLGDLEVGQIYELNQNLFFIWEKSRSIFR